MAQVVNTPNASPIFRSRAGNAAIPIIIHESGGTVHLNPKPGDVSVSNGSNLHLVVVNQTNSRHEVEVWFEFPLDGGTRGPYRIAVDANSVAPRTSIPVHVSFPDGVNVIVDGYAVVVDNDTTIDPDVKIQR